MLLRLDDYDTLTREPTLPMACSAWAIGQSEPAPTFGNRPAGFLCGACIRHWKYYTGETKTMAM